MSQQDTKKILENFCWAVLEKKIQEEDVHIVAIPDNRFDDEHDDDDYAVRKDYELEFMSTQSFNVFAVNSYESLNIVRLETSHIHGWNDTDVGICFVVEGGECCDILHVERFEVHFVMEASSGREETILKCAKNRMLRAKFLWNADKALKADGDTGRLKKAVMLASMADDKNKVDVFLNASG
jgi:hypothetical protein